MSLQKFNVHFTKQELLTGTGIGVISAFMYSLAPLLIIFLDTRALNSFILATMQEFVSWILVVCLTNKPLKFLKQIWKNTKSMLGMIVIIAGIFGGPIAQVLYILSIQLAAQMSATATVLVNIAPIFTALLSRLLLEERLSFIAWTGLLLTSLAVIGLVIWQIITEFNKTILSPDPSDIQPWVKATWAIILSLLTAILYAIESTILHFAMSKSKNKIDEKDALILKAFSSSWIMLIFVLPIVSVIGGGYGYEGWVQFRIFGELKGLTFLFIIISSFAIAIGRILFFRSIKILNGSYGIAAQLAMLLWTPLLSLAIFGLYKVTNCNFGIIQSNILDMQIKDLYLGATQWEYYVFLVPVLIGLILLLFNEKFLKKDKDVWIPPMDLK